MTDYTLSKHELYKMLDASFLNEKKLISETFTQLPDFIHITFGFDDMAPYYRRLYAERLVYVTEIKKPVAGLEDLVSELERCPDASQIAAFPFNNSGIILWFSKSSEINLIGVIRD